MSYSCVVTYLLAPKKKGSDPDVRSTLRAVPATGSDPFFSGASYWLEAVPMNPHAVESGAERFCPLAFVVLPTFVGALIWLWATINLVRT